MLGQPSAWRPWGPPSHEQRTHLLCDLNYSLAPGECCCKPRVCVQADYCEFALMFHEENVFIINALIKVPFAAGL